MVGTIGRNPDEIRILVVPCIKALLVSSASKGRPDVESYDKEREYYLPFEKLPYCEAFNIEEVCNYITNTNMQEYEKNLLLFFTKYKSYDNGNASEKIAALIDKLNI